jgi:hypothetical protein
MLQITPAQFEKRYNISLSTQYRWRLKHKIPFQKIGSNILYDKATIDKMASEGTLNKTAYLSMQNKNKEVI